MVKRHSSFTDIAGWTSGSFCEAFSSGNQKKSWGQGEEERILSQQSAESAFKVREHPHDGIKREPSVQAPCKNLFMQKRFAEHTCSCLAVPYFASHTFTEQLKSFISLSPDEPHYKIWSNNLTHPKNQFPNSHWNVFWIHFLTVPLNSAVTRSVAPKWEGFTFNQD